MRNPIGHIAVTILTAAAAFADNPVDCPRRSLAEAVNRADENETVQFTGVCAGPIVIRTGGLQLVGAPGAAIEGNGRDALTISGARRVSVNNVELRNGRNGLAVVDGAHATIAGITAHSNSLNGLAADTASGLILNGAVITRNNGLHGLSLDTGSAATVSGTLQSSNNRVFGINVNGSALTFTRASVTVTGNALGIQIATGANAFLSDPFTVLNVNANQSTGLTIVSGGHMVSFGGAINASNNVVHGVSVNSKAGLDLDGGAVLTAAGNGRNGLLLQHQSAMAIFNTPQFSQQPGFSAVIATGNTGNGVGVLTDSTLVLVNQAKLDATGNQGVGLQGDGGATLSLRNTTATGNRTRDLQLSFGARADLQSLTVDSFTCDSTVLVRGASPVVCPR